MTGSAHLDGVERALAEARRTGRRSGEALDDRLREQERYERGRALASARPERLAHNWQLSEMERLAEFHAAVVNSRSWRLLQKIRAFFGRDW